MPTTHSIITRFPPIQFPSQLVGQGSLWAIALSCALGGCSAPGAKVASIQKEKEELIAAFQKERQTNRNLSERAAALETRLDQSEKQLAVLSGNGTRWADNRPNSSSPPTYPSSRVTEPQLAARSGLGKDAATGSPRSKVAPVEDASLAWKQHRPNITEAPPDLKLSSPKPSYPKASGELKALAARDSRLTYDPTTGLAKFTAPLPFESGSTALATSGRETLESLANWLRANSDSQLRVLVVGKPVAAGAIGNGKSSTRLTSRGLGSARAQVVAEYLDRHGVPDHRLAVTSIGGGISGTEDGGSLAEAGSQSVEIYLADTEAAIAGWGQPSAVRRR